MPKKSSYGDVLKTLERQEDNAQRASADPNHRVRQHKNNRSQLTHLNELHESEKATELQQLEQVADIRSRSSRVFKEACAHMGN